MESINKNENENNQPLEAWNFFLCFGLWVDSLLVLFFFPDWEWIPSGSNVDLTEQNFSIIQRVNNLKDIFQLNSILCAYGFIALSTLPEPVPYPPKMISERKENENNQPLEAWHFFLCFRLWVDSLLVLFFFPDWEWIPSGSNVDLTARNVSIIL